MIEHSTIANRARALVLHPYRTQNSQASTSSALADGRTLDACLGEAAGLAHAIDLEVADVVGVALRSITPATLLGSGKVEEFATYIEDSDIQLVIVDSKLTPVQQRNLERAWKCKVIDRTALILEIFGARARTHEGKLQVELAALNYQKGRLVRSWTHLERQRGGAGFMGGPGETQIELDRRIINDRVIKLKKELKQVTRTRELHRATRREVPFPVVAIVGYTNAGKSTLFNRLTQAKVLAQDKLFATLDPTMRALTLPSGLKIILSDTVGFVSNLPTELVAAFRATLEEVVEADVLLHVRDIAHPDTEAQCSDVRKVLLSLLDEAEVDARLLEVHNKIDQLSEDEQRSYEKAAEHVAIGFSALNGVGVPHLLEMIDKRLAQMFMKTINARVKSDDIHSLEWLYKNGKVLEQNQNEEYIWLAVQLTKENAARWEKQQKRA